MSEDYILGKNLELDNYIENHQVDLKEYLTNKLNVNSSTLYHVYNYYVDRGSFSQIYIPQSHTNNYTEVSFIFDCGSFTRNLQLDKRFDVKKVDFIILSHWHCDHFSLMVKLIELWIEYKPDLKVIAPRVHNDQSIYIEAVDFIKKCINENRIIFIDESDGLVFEKYGFRLFYQKSKETDENALILLLNNILLPGDVRNLSENIDLSSDAFNLFLGFHHGLKEVPSTLNDGSKMKVCIFSDYIINSSLIKSYCDRNIVVIHLANLQFYKEDKKVDFKFIEDIEDLTVCNQLIFASRKICELDISYKLWGEQTLEEVLSSLSGVSVNYVDDGIRFKSDSYK